MVVMGSRLYPMVQQVSQNAIGQVCRCDSECLMETGSCFKTLMMGGGTFAAELHLCGIVAARSSFRECFGFRFEKQAGNWGINPRTWYFRCRIACYRCRCDSGVVKKDGCFVV
jgi:hypothetical protein